MGLRLLAGLACLGFFDFVATSGAGAGFGSSMRCSLVRWMGTGGSRDAAVAAGCSGRCSGVTPACSVGCSVWGLAGGCCGVAGVMIMVSVSMLVATEVTWMRSGALADVEPDVCAGFGVRAWVAGRFEPPKKPSVV